MKTLFNILNVLTMAEVGALGWHFATGRRVGIVTIMTIAVE